jgi:hypothetical protein
LVADWLQTRVQVAVLRVSPSPRGATETAAQTCR